MPLRILIGADPELFVKEKATGRFVSAHDLMPGTKTEPHKVDRGAIQVDGVAAEFNIDPSATAIDFTTSITAVTGQLQNFLGDKYELVSEPTCTFPEDYFKDLPPDVRELGCNPDFNAWTEQVNTKPDGEVTTMRTAAGHVHIGWTEGADPTDPTHFGDCVVIARQLDYYLGMPSLMWDEDTKRRSLYGKAGSFRPKPYGIEYRALSNVWLRSRPLQNWVWNASFRAVIDLVQNGNRIEDKFGDIAREMIDGNVKWWTKESDQVSERRKMARTLWSHTMLEQPPPLPKPVDPKVVASATGRKGPDFSKTGRPDYYETIYKLHLDGNKAATRILVSDGVDF